MATQTIQVKNFYKIAKQIGLKRGEFSARSPIDKHGEYKPMEVTIYVRTTEEQVRELAKHYLVSIYKMNGETMWHRPTVHYNSKVGLELWNLDEKNEHGLNKVTKLA